MLNGLIHLALNHRLFALALALAVMVYGWMVAARLPIDVFPDISRPRVAVITECPGASPEEVEMLVTLPLEMTLSGAPGVETIRSVSEIGLSVVNIEFGWSADIYRARQIVQERIANVRTPYESKLAPITTLLGQIAMIGMWSESEETSPMDVRTLADWTVRRKLLQVPGVAQVIVMGGERRQFQVLIDPHQLHQFDVSMEEVRQALQAGNLNVSGGYIDDGGRELLIRGIGRIESLSEIEQLVVKRQATRSVLVGDISRVIAGPQPKRGDASINGRDAVVLTVQKQPGIDTRAITQHIREALDDLRPRLPADIALEMTYEQRQFIDFSVNNVVEAIRDGALLVVIVLVIFLLNIRATLITLTAIPLSLLATFLVFKWYGLTINVMTLGGIAIALGELVDDAIVGVEIVVRRLKENAQAESPRSAIRVVSDATVEVRHAIFSSTVIVILVFVPLFFLSGIEGRLFAPLATAYVVSILASTVVSLTITPALAYYMLPPPVGSKQRPESWIVRYLKSLVTPVVQWSLKGSGFVAAISTLSALLLVSIIAVSRMGMNFLPPFDEGASQVNLFLPVGASLESSRQVSRLADERLAKLLRSETNPTGPIAWFTCKNGRAEEDEHVMGVNVTEYTLALHLDSGIKKQQLEDLLFEQLQDLVGVEIEVEQPIEHLIGHMLAGVNADIAVKVFGPDLSTLRRTAEEIRNRMNQIDGLTTPLIDQQQLIPQLRIVRRPEKYQQYGVTTDQVNRLLETALKGVVVSQVLIDQQTIDLVLRFDEPWRSDVDRLDRLAIEVPHGPRLPLSELAHIETSLGPSSIKRENTQRLISVRSNTLGRDLSSLVGEIRRELQDIALPVGYTTEIGGHYQAQQSAARSMFLFGALALVGIIVVLYANFQSTSLVCQILLAVPAGFVGGVAGLLLTGQSLSIAALVGFISLGGIAIRNGILLIEAYRRRQVEMNIDTEDLTPAIVQGNLDRLSPVMMTTLTTAFALLPLVLGGTLPGKEVLYPVAMVIVGGLISSTLAEFSVRPGLYRFLHVPLQGHCDS